MDQNNTLISGHGNQYIDLLSLSNIEIGLSNDLIWVIKKGEQIYELNHDFLKMNEFIVWLPLLENNIDFFEQKVKEAICQKKGGLTLIERNMLYESFPKAELIRVALEGKSEYWIDLGIKWLEALPKQTVLKDCLNNISIDKRVSQRLRHKALKLLASMR